jgi:hypothetical protein
VVAAAASRLTLLQAVLVVVLDVTTHNLDTALQECLVRVTRAAAAQSAITRTEIDAAQAAVALEQQAKIKYLDEAVTGVQARQELYIPLH